MPLKRKVGMIILSVYGRSEKNVGSSVLDFIITLENVNKQGWPVTLWVRVSAAAAGISVTNALPFTSLLHLESCILPKEITHRLSNVGSESDALHALGFKSICSLITSFCRGRRWLARDYSLCAQFDYYYMVCRFEQMRRFTKEDRLNSIILDCIGMQPFAAITRGRISIPGRCACLL